MGVKCHIAKFICTNLYGNTALLTNSLKIGYDEYRNLFGNKTAEILQHHPITHTTIDIIESNTFIYNIPLYSYFKSNKLLKYYAFQLPGKT